MQILNVALPIDLKMMGHIYSKARILTIIATMLSSVAMAQSVISGKVLDEKEKPVKGASVYLLNTIDGTTTDSLGNFRFSTDEKGSQTLVATELAHKEVGMPLNITGNISDIKLVMKEVRLNTLEQVTITAGSMEATNDKDKTVLKPLDIITTAGTQADVVRAIQTLPGTQQQGTQNGLFVRGGDASEANLVVDEMIAQNAFFSSAPGVVSRSRFGPWQFKGVAFSSGGYSARYGQALSSVLELNSTDLPDKSTINTGINMAGVYFSGDKLWKNSSFSGGASYNNLTPFYGLANTTVDYYVVPQGGSANFRYMWKPNKDGILKVMANGSVFKSGVTIPMPTNDSGFAAGNPSTVNFGLTNENYYTNISYRQILKKGWNIYTAASFSYNKEDIEFAGNPMENHDDRSQFRFEVKRYVNARFGIMAGTELQYFNYANSGTSFGYNFDQGFSEKQAAGYVEVDWTPVYWLAFRPGIRYEYSALLKQNAISPRFSMAIKAGQNGQFSLASGIFYQNADPQYFLAGYRPKMQQSVHYIANYQLIKGERTFRLEAYYKDYDQLVREHVSKFDPNSYRVIYPANSTMAYPIDNSGYGYAKGIELFWRDKKSIKFFDYWLSYSYIDTRRLYKNFTKEATPNFIADHNLSLITKYFINDIQTNISATYAYASGRPYYNPDPAVDFMSQRTKDFHNISLTISWLHSFGKWFTVFYAGVDNLANTKNVFGKRYDANGNFIGDVQPALYRTVFVGVNFSLSEFNKDEL
jgi:hypothetical protein